MHGYRQSKDYRIDFEDGYDPTYFDIELDFYVHDGSGNRFFVTTTIECLYDPSPDEAYDEPYFVAHIGRLCFDGTTSDSAAYLVLDGVMLEDLCPSSGYNLPHRMDRFKVCLDIDVCKDPDGGGYFKVRVWVYQMVLLV